MEALVVTAINIGEVYSGYAYSFLSDFYEDPLQQRCVNWTGHYDLDQHKRIPTSILLNTDHKFEAFGFEAENRYLTSLEGHSNDEFCFFQYFLINANKHHGTKDDFLARALNKDVDEPLELLITYAVSYLVDHFLKLFNSRNHGIKESEILWFLSYPDDLAESLIKTMYVTAINLNINPQRIKLASEQSCSVAFCKANDHHGLLLDCGLTQLFPSIISKPVSEFYFNIMEMSPIAGILEKVIKRYTGHSLFSCFSMLDRCEIMFEFERKLYTADVNQKTFVLKIPASSDYSRAPNIKNDDRNKYTKPIRFVADKVRFDMEIILEIIQEALCPFVERLREAIGNKNICRQTIALVGDFSQYSIIQSILQNNFTNYYFAVYPNSNFSVLKGAAILGHKSSKGILLPVLRQENKTFIRLQKKLGIRKTEGKRFHSFDTNSMVNVGTMTDNEEQLDNYSDFQCDVAATGKLTEDMRFDNSSDFEEKSTGIFNLRHHVFLKKNLTLGIFLIFSSILIVLFSVLIMF